MSVDNSIYLVYGVSYGEEDDFTLAELNMVYGDEDSDPQDMIRAEMSETGFFKDYPGLGAMNNGAVFYEESPNDSLIIYAPSSMRVLLDGRNPMLENFPVITSALKNPRGEDVDKLKKFYNKFPSTNPPGWIVVATVT